MCALTAQRCLYIVENFVKFGLVTSELTEFIRESLIRHGQNWHIWSNIFRPILPIFAIFTPCESALSARQMINLDFFKFVKGRCHGNQIILRKCYQRRLIPLTFVALVLENELQYHGLAVCINSANDASISCENLVKCCPVTQELTELICERHVRHGSMILFRYYLLGSNTTAPSGLYARLCDAFLVSILKSASRCHKDNA